MIGLLSQVRSKLVQLERRGDREGIRIATGLLDEVEKFTVKPPVSPETRAVVARNLAMRVDLLLKL